jgi:hypothetical protein
MTPKKQVSPAIRILRGERDASARATHLEAATRKFLVTTNERKYMSTKTNFKRIALVAVAALGMGVLSSVPSQAVISSLAVSNTAGAAGLTGAKSDSTTGGLVTITSMALTASTDSYSVTVINKSRPALATAQPALLLMLQDTATSTTAATARAVLPTAIAALNFTTESATSVVVTAGTGAGYMNSKFKAFMESTTGSGAADRVAGDYVYTVVVTPFSTNVNAGVAGTAVTTDITISITALTTDSTVVSPATSTAFIGTSTGATADAVISALATASDTPKGYLTVTLKNAAGGTAARESVTITTTIGQVGTSANRGRSVVLAYTGATDYNIYSDGTAGTGTITVSTPSVTFSTKTVTFYAAAAKTITATVAHPLLKVGANSGAVRGVAVDANGVAWAGTAYIVASSAADALIAGSTTPVDCGAYDATNARFNCPVTAIAAGTAKFKIIDAATVALATATSNEVTVTVSIAAVAKVAISFDKATYAPNERMRIYVTAQDASGASLPAATYTNLLASGGITANSGFSGSSDTTSATAVTTSASSSSVTGAKAGSAMYTVYAPAAGGTVTITATGGASLPLAGQVAVTATATVTDSGAAALAAVTALATTVASLKTLITTLTNLVLKIQKKVKA